MSDTEDMPKEFVIFEMRYRDILVLKKMRITEDTTPEEVAFMLSGIKNTSINSTYRTSGIDTRKLDELANRLSKRTGRGGKALESLDRIVYDGDVERELLEACNNDKSNSRAARAYLIISLLKRVNMPPFITQEQMAKIYPKLKVSKGMGRKAKA